MLISTNLADFKNENLAKDPFYEQIKALNTALVLFADKHLKNIQKFLDSREIQAARTRLYDSELGDHEVLVLDVSRRLLITISKKYTNDVISVVYHPDAEEFQKLEIKADPNQYPDEEAKWALIHVGLQMVYAVMKKEELDLQAENNMKIEIYQKAEA